MEMSQKVLYNLLSEYEILRAAHGFPPLRVHFEALMPEMFRVQCAGGEISIYGCDNRALAYGVCHISMGLRSQHLAEALGAVQPQYPLRPLWLDVQAKVAITPSISLALPKLFLVGNSDVWVERLYLRLIQGGYNALLLGSRSTGFASQNTYETEVLSDGDFSRLKDLFHSLQTAGIKLIFKPDIAFSSSGACFKSPYDPYFCGRVQQLLGEFFEKLPECKNFFWESLLLNSSYRYHPKAHEATQLETVVEELHVVEKNLSNGVELIFYIPACTPNLERQSAWLPSLIDEMSNSTIFAFSAVAGDIAHDTAENHPFWEVLRKSIDASATRLLPILNFGLVGQGEGLWPTINADLLERFLPRFRRHNFTGALAYWNEIPTAGSISDCSFWIAGWGLWRSVPTSLLVETWFAAYFPEDDFSTSLTLMKEARSISLDLFHLRALALELGRALCNSEKHRLLAESLIGQIKALKSPLRNTRKIKAVTIAPALSDMLPFFVADVARFLHHLMPVLSISLFRGLDMEHDGFWSRKSKEQAPAAESYFPKQPLCGHTGTMMEAIYRASRIFSSS